MKTPTAPARVARWCVGAGVATAAAVVFYATLLFSGPLDHYDWASHHKNYFDWVRISAVRHHTLPLYMQDAWVTENFIGNPEAPILGPLVWLLPLLGTDAYIKLLIVVFTAAGLVGMFLLLRDFGVSPAVAAAPAVAFAFNGFFPAHLGVGHHWAMGVALLPGLLLLLRAAIRGRRGAVYAAAALDAFTILGGQHQAFIWQNVVLVAYAALVALQRRSLLPVLRLSQVLAWTAGLGAVKLLPVLFEFSSYDPTARTPGLPVSQLLFALVGRGQGPATVVPSLEFSHGAGWWEYAFYAGPGVLLCLVAGLAAGRRSWPLAAIGAFFLVIAVDGGEGFDLWSRLMELPVWRTQRSPSRFLILALFAFLVVAGVGMQRICERARGRWAVAARAAAVALAALIFVDLSEQSRSWQQIAIGDEFVSRTHHPLRTELRPGPDAVAKLHGFAPNRMVWHVEADESARFVFPMRYAKGARAHQHRGEEVGPSDWRIDGFAAVADDGMLAVDVPPGTRDLVMRYRPRGFVAGASVSSVAVLMLGGAIVFRRSGRRSRSREPSDR